MMVVSKNGMIRRPGAKAFIIQRSDSGDGIAIRNYMTGTNGFNAFNIATPVMGDSAWTKTQAIGSYVFQKMYYTGFDELNYGGEVTRALKVLQMLDANQSNNSGKGPYHICSTISYTMRGILASYGVISRTISGHTAGANADIGLEIFCPEFNKWVFYIPFAAAYVLLPDGNPAGSLELKNYYKNNNVSALTFKSGTSTIQTDTGYDRYGTVYSSWWTGILTPSTPSAQDIANLAAGGYFYHTGWDISNAYNIPLKASAANVTPHYFTQECINYFAIDAESSSALSFVLVSPNDIFPTFNIIQASRIGFLSESVGWIEFDHCLISFDKYQTSSDGTTWVDVPGDSVSFDPSARGTLYIRALNTSGVPSNIVQLAS